MVELEALLSAFEEALELERELGTRTVELDRALLRPVPSNAANGRNALNVLKDPNARNGSNGLKAPDAVKVANALNGPNATDAVKAANALNGPNAPDAVKAPNAANGDSGSLADFAFLLESDPVGPVAELLPKMSEAIGYGPDGVRINDPSARVLIVLGRDALNKWLPGVLARPGQWLKRGETPALVTASPTKTYRFHGNDPAKITQLKRRLWEDLKAALARLGKKPPVRQKGA